MKQPKLLMQLSLAMVGVVFTNLLVQKSLVLVFGTNSKLLIDKAPLRLGLFVEAVHVLSRSFLAMGLEIYDAFLL